MTRLLKTTIPQARSRSHASCFALSRFSDSWKPRLKRTWLFPRLRPNVNSETTNPWDSVIYVQSVGSPYVSVSSCLRRTDSMDLHSGTERVLDLDLIAGAFQDCAGLWSRSNCHRCSYHGTSFKYSDSRKLSKLLACPYLYRIASIPHHLPTDMPFLKRSLMYLLIRVPSKGNLTLKLKAWTPPLIGCPHLFISHPDDAPFRL